MARCAQCTFENVEGATKCEQCGAELTMEVLSAQLGQVCRHCDSYNEPGVALCISCGKPLSSVASDERPTPGPKATPTPQPWLAPPDTGEFSARKPLDKQPETTPAAAPAPVSAGIVSALPPSALPPGWSAPAAKPSVAVARGPQEPMVSCPRCKRENPPSARYCGTCGAGLLPAPGAAKARGKLILIRGVGPEGRQFPLLGAANTAGRTEGVLTFQEDPYISALHATFLFRGDDLVVKDEGAANGVYIRVREPQVLRPGDMFNIGERLLRYAGTVTATPSPVARHGSPRNADRFQVIEEILESGGVGRICKRAGPVITIGRAGCDLNFPSDGFVSARHAELSLAGETTFLRDLGSANGTFLRIQPRAERTLAHGDYVLMGRELLRVELNAGR